MVWYVKKKTLKNTLIILGLIIITGLVLAKDTTTGHSQSNNNIISNNTRVEVYHFHSTQQCYSCRKLGELTENTLNNYFSEELNSGEIVFAHINVDLQENQEIFSKYGATGSSLMIGTYVNSEFHKEENIRVWYKINNEIEFMNYLKSIVEKRLNGDLS